MTTNQPNSGRSPDLPQNAGEYAHLDASLASLARELDVLGSVERDASPDGMRDRLMAATMPHVLGVATVSAQVSELGAMERAAASGELESRVHEASRGKLSEVVAGRPALRLSGTQADAPVVRRSLWTSRAFRVAAMLTIVCTAGIFAWVGTREPSSGVQLKNLTKDELNRQIRGDMELLFAAMDDRSVATDHSGSESDVDTDAITEWLLEGASS